MHTVHNVTGFKLDRPELEFLWLGGKQRSEQHLLADLVEFPEHARSPALKRQQTRERVSYRDELILRRRSNRAEETSASHRAVVWLSRHCRAVEKHLPHR